MVHIIKGQTAIVVLSVTEMRSTDVTQGSSQTLDLEEIGVSLPFLQESFDGCVSHLHPNEPPKMRRKNKNRYRLVYTIVLYASFLAFVSIFFYIVSV